MKEMILKYKKLAQTAKEPIYAHASDAGADLYCSRREIDPRSNKVIYHTDIAIQIPEGYVGLVYPRSGIHKTGQSVANSVGVIDSGYTGEIRIVTYLVENNVDAPIVYEVGDRIAQIIIQPYPKLQFTEVEELEQTERGEGGFGSTGK